MTKVLLAALSIVSAMALAVSAADYNGTNTIGVATTETGTNVGYNNLVDTNTLTVTDTGSLTTGGLYIGRATSSAYYGTTGTLVAEGDVTASTLYIGCDGVGTLIVDGGDVLVSGYLYAGFNGNTSTEATITLNSGSLTVSGIVQMGYKANSTITITQNGGVASYGTLNVGYVASSTAGYAISNGTFSVASMNLGTSAGTSVAEFDVIGSAATLNVTTKLTAYSGSVLGFTVDAGGVSTINAAHTQFSAGSLIDLNIASGVTVADGTVLTLIVDQDGYIDISNLGLAGGDEYIDGVQSGWVLSSASSSVLATYYAVPEPATMGLLGVGVLGLALKRRRAA